MASGTVDGRDRVNQQQQGTAQHPSGEAAPDDPAHAGVAIADSDGVLLWTSGPLRQRLHALGASGAAGSACCAVLGCASNTQVGETRCLTRLALARGGLTPRPWRAGSRDGGLLTAEVVHGGSGPLVIFELELPARPPGAALPSSPVADVQVLALGPMSVRIGDRLVDGDWLQQRPGQTFRYLVAFRGSAARSEAIADALWPDRGPSAVANVRYAVYKLRERLDDGRRSARSLILRTAGGYRLDPQRLVVDVDVFQSKVAAGLAAYHADRPHAAESALAEALEHYRDDFLSDDPYAEWAFVEREYLRGLAAKALGARARIALAGDRLETASACLLRLAQLEPFDSQVHQLLIGVCLRRGRRTEALRHYSALRVRLARAFGEKPDFDLARVAAGLAGASE
jgi:DNA-binding SARP family transcriptional activator